MRFIPVFLAALVACSAASARAGLVTVEFSGTIGGPVGTNVSTVFNTGDTFTGYYTYESTVVPDPHPNSSLDTQANVISSSLPGTGWGLTVQSTLVSPFSITGLGGRLSLGNDTAFGDRYIAELFGPVAASLPTGLQKLFTGY